MYSSKENGPCEGVILLENVNVSLALPVSSSNQKEKDNDSGDKMQTETKFASAGCRKEPANRPRQCPFVFSITIPCNREVQEGEEGATTNAQHPISQELWFAAGDRGCWCVQLSHFIVRSFIAHLHKLP